MPEGKVDEVAFNASRPGSISVCSVLSLECVSVVRLRALGHHQPGSLCASASTTVDGQKATVDGPFVCMLQGRATAFNFQIRGRQAYHEHVK